MAGGKQQEALRNNTCLRAVCYSCACMGVRVLLKANACTRPFQEQGKKGKKKKKGDFAPSRRWAYAATTYFLEV